MAGLGTHSGGSGTGTDPSTRSGPAVAPPGKSAQPPALALPELLTLFQHNSNSFHPLRRMGCCAISTITITMHLQGFSWLALSFVNTSLVHIAQNFYNYSQNINFTKSYNTTTKKWLNYAVLGLSAFVSSTAVIVHIDGNL